MSLGKERGVEKVQSVGSEMHEVGVRVLERKRINKAKGLALRAKDASAIYGELWLLFWLSISLLGINCYCLLSCNASL